MIMQKTIIFFLLTSACLNISLVFGQSNVKTADNNTHLQKFRSDYIRSILDKKPEMIQDYYAEDIRLMPEFQKTIVGKENVLTYHNAFSTRFNIQSYNRNEIEVLDLGSRIVELGMFAMKIKLKATGKEYEVNGKYLNIWDKK